MNNRQIFAVLAIVALYYVWHVKGMTAQSRQLGGVATPNTGRRGGIGKSLSTLTSGARTNPRSSRQLPAQISPRRGSGRNYVTAPIAGPAFLNQGGGSRQGVGTGRLTNRSVSASWSGTGAGPTSSVWPTFQQNSTKRIRVGSGAVQIPSYTVVPLTRRGPGGQGTVLNLSSGGDS